MVGEERRKEEGKKGGRSERAGILTKVKGWETQKTQGKGKEQEKLAAQSVQKAEKARSPERQSDKRQRELTMVMKRRSLTYLAFFSLLFHFLASRG